MSHLTNNTKPVLKRGVANYLVVMAVVDKLKSATPKEIVAAIGMEAVGWDVRTVSSVITKQKQVGRMKSHPKSVDSSQREHLWSLTPAGEQALEGLDVMPAADTAKQNAIRQTCLAFLYQKPLRARAGANA